MGMSLYDNAVKSIRVGVSDAQSTDDGRVLSALRNIYAGILLLIKVKLSRLSPQNSNEVLIRPKISPILNADGTLTFVGTSRSTVDYHEMQNRCKSLNIAIEWDRIDKINTIRNEVEHYFTTCSAGAIRGILANSFILVRDIISVQLGDEPALVLGQDTWAYLLENAEVYDKERMECKIALKSVDWRTEILAGAVEQAVCEVCGSDLLIPLDVSSELEDIQLKCRSCGAGQDFETFAPSVLRSYYAYSAYQIAKDGGDEELISCPFCDKFGYSMTEEVCLICGEQAIHECSRCGGRIPSSEIDGGSLCGYCRHMWQRVLED
jgi:hypothetical protein